MKTLKFALVSALIALSTSAFAGNNENCSSCEMLNSTESASLLKSDSASLSDTDVKGMLRSMTQTVREKVNGDEANMILQNMTQVVRQKVNSNTSDNAF